MGFANAFVEKNDSKVQEALGLIEGRKRLGQKREPRRIHPFPARLPIAIARHLVEELTCQNAIVLDPMVGSGTTLIAARTLGRQGIGLDRDHLAVRLARCACSAFDREELKSLSESTLKRARKIVKSRSFELPNVRSKLPEEETTFIRYWFPPASQKQLFALAKAVREIEVESQRDVAWVVFSSLIIAKSAGASHAMDISRSRPHKRLDKEVILPFDAWDVRFREAISRLPFVGTQTTTEPSIGHGDARKLSLSSSSVDFVLTSPPYRNAIDYLRGHKFSLIWMGHRLSELRELRGTMIGTERGLWELDGLPPELEIQLQRRVKESRQIATSRQYLSDLRKVLGELYRVLRPKGLALLVIGPTMFNAQKTDAEDIVGQLAAAAGFYQVGSVVREIDASRRSLPIPQLFSGSDLGKRMRREVIVAFRKP
jgi:DNA modification methylase